MAYDQEMVDVEIRARDVPTVLVDQIIGFTAVEGVGRATFGQIVFAYGSPNPVAHPVISLAATRAGWGRLHEQIGTIIKQLEDDQSEVKTSEVKGLE